MWRGGEDKKLKNIGTIQLRLTGAGVVGELMKNRNENAAQCCSRSQGIVLYQRLPDEDLRIET